MEMTAIPFCNRIEEPDAELNPLQGLFKEYERVIVESVLTSFGLDRILFANLDQHGGSVDTIHNVRKIGTDEQMCYKNPANQAAYDARGDYSSAAYHNDPNSNFARMKREAKNYSQGGETPRPIQDEYTGGELYFLGRSKNAPSNKNAELDHVMSAKEIHEDRGRILAGLDGKELADRPENLRFTNKSLNASMGKKDIPQYIAEHPEMPQEQKDNMMRAYNASRRDYERKLQMQYYTSPAFAKDVTLAAGKIGAAMGLRQAVGFIFVELWFSIKEEFQKVKNSSEFGMEQFMESVARGVQNGAKSVKVKYKELFERMGQGMLSGVLSSITTTLCNIFFTTAKSMVMIIRQSWASIVDAVKVLFINPDNLLLGEQLRAAAKIIAVGASVVIGRLVTEAISKTAIGMIPDIGQIIQDFVGILTTGTLSCTLLYFFDHSELIAKLVKKLDHIQTVDMNIAIIQQNVKVLQQYAAELMRIDYEQFRRETELYQTAAIQIEHANGPKELNAVLTSIYQKAGWTLPWQGDFDTFMSDRNNRLVFS